MNNWIRTRHTCPVCQKIEFIERADYEKLPDLQQIGIDGKFMVCKHCKSVLNIAQADSHNLKAIQILATGKAIFNYLIW